MPSFESDLRATREAAGHSLGDIQQKTRIPVDVLHRFEEGELVGDPTYNEVYLKAFIQSYAKAVGLAPSAVVAGYAAHRQGSYQGELSPDYDGAPIQERTPPPAATPSAAAPPAVEVPPVDVPPGEAPATGRPPVASGLPPAVQALQTAPTPRPASADDKPKTLAQARVNRPVVPSAKRSFDKNWGTILGLFALLVIGLAAALYFLVFAGDSDDIANPDTVVVGDTGAPIAIDSSGVGAGAATGGPQLQLPITLTVTASGGALQNFRVTAAPDDRRGYWLKEGDSETFQSDSLIVLWGEGADGLGPNAMLELQGQRWTPATGGILRIDRASAQALLDSLATAGTGGAVGGGSARGATAAPSASDVSR